MCGIVAVIAKREVSRILLDGLHRLEYRGYDSAGIAVINDEQCLHRLCSVGNVAALEEALDKKPLTGTIGIAHTRWATHGEPSERNAHPHTSGSVAVVHNGIIENYEYLRQQLIEQGYVFVSQTDTEVIAHAVNQALTQEKTLLSAVQHVLPTLQGAYGTVMIDSRDPNVMVAARSGSPLVIGLGEGENFVASDPLALLPVTRRFIFLLEGDVAEITRDHITIYDSKGNCVTREINELDADYDAGDKGHYQHYMQKEIYEQPQAIKATLQGRLQEGHIHFTEFSDAIKQQLCQVEHVHIIACGTSYNAGLVARYWLESIAGIACDVEIASEFRYRPVVVRNNSLFVTLSQSGETADTLAALMKAKMSPYLMSLAICNVAGSSLVRESDVALMTKAGAEIGVASTKAFTTQLTVLLMLVGYLVQLRQGITPQTEQIVHALQALPNRIEHLLTLDEHIAAFAPDFADKHHALYLGRGDEYPIAIEGALKLKEISYIHAEAYAAGELKHGPLALVDKQMPVVVIAAKNALFDKLKSNIEEVRARGGQIYLFADEQLEFSNEDNIHLLSLPTIEEVTAPIFNTIPQQLLAYYVALVKGTNVDKPRNLAKSVTVE